MQYLTEELGEKSQREFLENQINDFFKEFCIINDLNVENETIKAYDYYIDNVRGVSVDAKEQMRRKIKNNARQKQVDKLSRKYIDMYYKESLDFETETYETAENYFISCGWLEPLPGQGNWLDMKIKYGGGTQLPRDQMAKMGVRWSEHHPHDILIEKGILTEDGEWLKPEYEAEMSRQAYEERQAKGIPERW